MTDGNEEGRSTIPATSEDWLRARLENMETTLRVIADSNKSCFTCRAAAQRALSDDEAIQKKEATSKPFWEELAHLKEHHAGLMATAPGQYVLIKRRNIAGIYKKEQDAIEEGRRRFPQQAFLVKQILFQEPTFGVPGGITYPDMTEEDKREQAISFVYGNISMTNPSVTREMVADAYDKKHQTKPRPEKLYCPDCASPHIDEGEWATKPHKTHLCLNCGHLWQPFDEPTVGV